MFFDMSPRFHNAKKELLSAERNILRELGFEATMGTTLETLIAAIF